MIDFILVVNVFDIFEIFISSTPDNKFNKSGIESIFIFIYETL